MRTGTIVSEKTDTSNLQMFFRARNYRLLDAPVKIALFGSETPSAPIKYLH